MLLSIKEKIVIEQSQLKRRIKSFFWGKTTLLLYYFLEFWGDTFLPEFLAGFAFELSHNIDCALYWVGQREVYLYFFS